jgi:hypothetical protein
VARAPCCINEVRVVAAHVDVLRINEMHHLERLGREA